MKKIINWRLYNNKKIVEEKENIECNFNNNKITYCENDYKNEIDIKNRSFFRENDEYAIKVNFNSKKIIISLKKDNLTYENEIKCEFKLKKDNLFLKYKLDEEIIIMVQIL